MWEANALPSGFFLAQTVFLAAQQRGVCHSASVLRVSRSACERIRARCARVRWVLGAPRTSAGMGVCMRVCVCARCVVFPFSATESRVIAADWSARPVVVGGPEHAAGTRFMDIYSVRKDMTTRKHAVCSVQHAPCSRVGAGLRGSCAMRCDVVMMLEQTRCWRFPGLCHICAETRRL